MHDVSLALAAVVPELTEKLFEAKDYHVVEFTELL